MRAYRYAIAITSQFFFCGIPFRLDSAPKCTLNCAYCYAMAKGGRNTSLDLLAQPERIGKLFSRSKEDDEKIDIVTTLIKRKLPLHFGGMSDPFANRIVSSTTKKILSILCNYDYPVVLSTKNVDELCKDDTIQLLKNFKHLVIQVSVSSLDKIASQLEPNVPSMNKRLEALSILSKEGFYTMARIQPLYPSHIDDVEQVLIPMLGEAKVKHAIVEFLKLPIEKNASFAKNLKNQYDLSLGKHFNEKYSVRVAREWLLLPKYKWDLLQPIIAAIHKSNMTYGAGDYGLNHLGDTSCCCGIDVVDGFSNYFRQNISYAIRHNQGRVILFNDLDADKLPKKSIRMYLNSHCRKDGLSSISDYLKWKWNRPGTVNAPDSYLGVTYSGEYDEEGNCIYMK